MENPAQSSVNHAKLLIILAVNNMHVLFWSEFSSLQFQPLVLLVSVPLSGRLKSFSCRDTYGL